MTTTHQSCSKTVLHIFLLWYLNLIPVLHRKIKLMDNQKHWLAVSLNTWNQFHQPINKSDLYANSSKIVVLRNLCHFLGRRSTIIVVLLDFRIKWHYEHINVILVNHWSHSVWLKVLNSLLCVLFLILGLIRQCFVFMQNIRTMLLPTGFPILFQSKNY